MNEGGFAMYGGNWFNQSEVAGNVFGRSAYGRGPVQFPPQRFPTTYEQPIVSPTQEFVRTNIYETVVPHIHPSHTTTVNRHHINNQHYFPHTESVVNECCETNTMCGCGTPHHHGHHGHHGHRRRWR